MRWTWIGLLLTWGCGDEGALSPVADPPEVLEPEAQEPETPAPETPEPDATEPLPEPEPDAPDPLPEPPVSERCVPAAADWATVGPVIDRFCGDCHGATPQFGASATLTTYEALVSGTLDGTPLPDLVAKRISEGSMPPAAQPRLAAAEARALVAWASCEAIEVVPEPNPGGLDATADVFEAPASPPRGMPFFDLTADAFQVPRQVDHYECFEFQAPLDGPRVIRRIEPLIDDSRVVHHMVLTRGHGCAVLSRDIYAWAPGLSALQFEDGGLRVAPGERFSLDVHYYNRPQHDTRDSSGVRVYHAPVQGPEVEVIAVGPLSIAVPPNARSDAEHRCTATAPTTIIASWPHMHQIGARFAASVVRADGSVHDLVTLNGWEFESQFVYETPFEIVPGDTIVTRCEYENLTGQLVTFGTGTEDEMCFNFIYHTPPLPRGGCR